MGRKDLANPSVQDALIKCISCLIPRRHQRNWEWERKCCFSCVCLGSVNQAFNLEVLLHCNLPCGGQHGVLSLILTRWLQPFLRHWLVTVIWVFALRLSLLGNMLQFWGLYLSAAWDLMLMKNIAAYLSPKGPQVFPPSASSKNSESINFLLIFQGLFVLPTFAENVLLVMCKKWNLWMI